MTQDKATKSLELLIVEDNPGDVEITRRILIDSKYNLNINVAEDGEVAMDYLHQEGAYASKPRPDLILLDLNMPKKDGYQVMQELRADPDLRTLPVMVLTSTSAENESLYGQGIRPNSFCKKPLNLFQFDHFVSQIGSAVLGALSRTDELPSHAESKPTQSSDDASKRFIQSG